MAKRDPRMVHLGYGRFVRADRIFALVPLPAAEPGSDGEPHRLFPTPSETLASDLGRLGVPASRRRTLVRELRNRITQIGDEISAGERDAFRRLTDTIDWSHPQEKDTRWQANMPRRAEGPFALRER